MSVVNNNLLLAGDDSYVIERSVRLRSSASAYLTRTPNASSNRQTWTWSGWMKRGAVDSGLYVPFSFGDNSTGPTDVGAFARFHNNALEFIEAHGGVNSFALTTTQVFRDPAAWYHFVFSADTTQATASNRLKIFVNGTQITAFSTATYPSQNFNTSANQAGNAQRIGVIDVDGTISGQYFDGYLTEINFIDGQALTPTSFGEYNEDTGVWQPKKYAGTYGTNGFYLNFSDPSAATAAAIGKDYSGNGNNWTPNNISVTAGVTYDSMIDTPTPVADERGNFCVMNRISQISTSTTISGGNLNAVLPAASTTGQGIGTIGVTSGKWYWETTYTASTGDFLYVGVGEPSSGTPRWLVRGADGELFGPTAPGAATAIRFASGDVIGIALDADNSKWYVRVNGAWQLSGDPIAGTGFVHNNLSGVLAPRFSNATGSGSQTISANFGQRPFAYTPPSGFKALHTGNLPEPTIKRGNEYFNTVLYTGNATARSITGVGFQPDFVWTKSRSGAESHRLYDAVRGATKSLYSNLTNAETTEAQSLTAFGSDGFSLGTGAPNSNAVTYVAWNWKANGAGVSNTAGSITSTVSAGVTQGFSVVTWTGTSNNASTIGHGLGVAPKLIITKGRTNPTSWVVGIGGISGFGVNDYLVLNSTNAKATSSTFYQAYGSSTFTVGVSAADEMNKTGNNYVSYCFAEVPGFSKFGSYTGNGSADGPFVFCGFRPAFVLIKNSSASGWNWFVWDTARSVGNESSLVLLPNASDAELTNRPIDILSNGFKIRATDTHTNGSGNTMIYAAFAENPFKNALAR